ncbi:hypothetical protein N9L68_03350, partial [bacterium]|nr:hypothetical protein [bacterium]
NARLSQTQTGERLRTKPAGAHREILEVGRGASGYHYWDRGPCLRGIDRREDPGLGTPGSLLGCHVCVLTPYILPTLAPPMATNTLDVEFASVRRGIYIEQCGAKYVGPLVLLVF